MNHAWAVREPPGMEKVGAPFMAPGMEKVGAPFMAPGMKKVGAPFMAPVGGREARD